AARTYGIQLNSAGQAVVNGPWSNDNTTYTGSTSITINGSNVIQRAALTGDVTAPANSNTLTIASNAVTNAKAADMPGLTIKGNATGSSADPQDLSAAQVAEMLQLKSDVY